ncbi:hypothetical protein AB7315_06825 [Providencia manganoxydans]|uniref:hypothetical protein n=1 Tax=Providencia manganoxydans TaxID=2923283 RepID=UPI0034E3F4D5
MEDIKSTIRHEAGHWLAALETGLNPKEIQISLTGSFPSFANIDCDKVLKSLSEVSDYLTARIVTLYAGAYAANFDGESFDYEAINKDFSPSGGAYIDFMRIGDLYKVYKNINPSGGYSDAASDMIDKAMEIVMNNYCFIKKLSEGAIVSAELRGNSVFFSQELLVKLYDLSKENPQ